MIDTLKAYFTKKNIIFTMLIVIGILLVYTFLENAGSKNYTNQNGNSLVPTSVPTTVASTPLVFYPSTSTINVTNVRSLFENNPVSNDAFSLNGYTGTAITEAYIASRLNLIPDTNNPTGQSWKSSLYTLSSNGSQYSLFHLAGNPKKITISTSDATNDVVNIIKQVTNLSRPYLAIDQTIIQNNEFVFNINVFFNGHEIFPPAHGYMMNITLFGNGQLDGMHLYPFPIDFSLIDSYQVQAVKDVFNSQDYRSATLFEYADDASVSQYANQSITLANFHATTFTLGYLYTQNSGELIPAYILRGTVNTASFTFIVIAVDGANLNQMSPTPTPTAINLGDG